MTNIDLSQLVTSAEIARMLDVSRQRVSELVVRDDFPKPVGQVGRSSVWLAGDVKAWVRTWNRRGARPKKA